MRAVAVLLFALAAAPAEAGECKPPRGKPVYREERGPLRPPPDGQPLRHPVVDFEIFASGAWTRVQSGEAGSGEALGQSGCLSPAARKAVARLVARARFVTDPRAITCEAVPSERVLYAAPRRGVQVVSQEPCGAPIDPSLAQLAACARALAFSSRASELPQSCR